MLQVSFNTGYFAFLFHPFELLHDCRLFSCSFGSFVSLLSTDILYLRRFPRTTRLFLWPVPTTSGALGFGQLYCSRLHLSAVMLETVQKYTLRVAKLELAPHPGDCYPPSYIQRYGIPFSLYLATGPKRIHYLTWKFYYQNLEMYLLEACCLCPFHQHHFLPFP